MNKPMKELIWHKVKGRNYIDSLFILEVILKWDFSALLQWNVTKYVPVIE